MQYLGGKAKLKKDLEKIILAHKKDHTCYVEPFVGGASVMSTVSKHFDTCIANDTHYYLIKMWQALQQGWTPPTEVSREEYYEIKNNKDDYPPELVGFVGFACAFGGTWFAGYATGKNGNYALSAINSLKIKLPNLKSVKFENKDYRNLYIPENSLIYCDPPYQNSTRYRGLNKFNHEMFFEWCREKAKEGHTVLVSEYSAPDDFECVFIKEVGTTVYHTCKALDTRVEKVYLVK